MFKYIVKRLLYVVFVFFIVSIIMFGVYKMIPGDPARMMLDSSISSVDPERYEAMYQAARERLGLDKPLPIQYVNWITNMLRGDFGYSSQYRVPVSQLIKEPMLNTIKLNIVSLILVFAITIPLGIASAVKKYSAFDNAVQVGTVVGYSLPSFVISLLMIFLFAVQLPIFPISGVNSPGFAGTGWERFLDTAYHMCLPVLVMTLSSLGGITRYVRSAMIDVLQMDYIRTARAKGLPQKVVIMCLPVLVMTLSSLGGITRYVRSAMIDVLQMDYIRTARAKGLPQKVVIYSHAFRNALIPVVTILTSWFVGIFGGSVVIESIFQWNGMGKVMIDGLRQLDFMVVLAMQMFYVVITLIGNLIMDLGYSLVDPHVSASTGHDVELTRRHHTVCPQRHDRRAPNGLHPHCPS